MSQRIEDFIAAIRKPGPLQQALRKAGKQVSNEQVAEIARAHGFDLQAAELTAYATSHPRPEESQELSDQDLEVAGGTSFKTIFGDPGFYSGAAGTDFGDM
jgi:predicted ribosomally synthesized peptide with nif11-like leader